VYLPAVAEHRLPGLEMDDRSIASGGKYGAAFSAVASAHGNADPRDHRQLIDGFIERGLATSFTIWPSRFRCPDRRGIGLEPEQRARSRGMP